MATKKAPESVKLYICELCNFTCSRIYDFTRHNSTRKHEKLQLATKKAPESVKKTDSPPAAIEKSCRCDCGNEYKHMSSLYKHKRKCPGVPPADTATPVSVDTPMNALFSPDAFMELINYNRAITQQNQDFKDMMMQQSAKIMELSNNPKIINNNSTNNTQNINQFNLHFFLNEQCKDAQNLDEFIEDIIVDMDDIKYMDQVGYSEGMTNIIAKQMNKTDIFKRPIHCTDLKRETIYVKNNDRWTKEGPNQENLHRIINTTYRKNQKEVRTFLQENPHLSDTKSPEWDYYMRLVRSSMGGICEYEDDRYAVKIIKGLAKMVLVDKCG